MATVEGWGTEVIKKIQYVPIGLKIGTDANLCIEILKINISWKGWGQRSRNC